MSDYTPSIERCIAEQKICAANMRSDPGDRFGAMLGAQDWIKEEVLLRLEQLDASTSGLAGPLTTPAARPGPQP